MDSSEKALYHQIHPAKLFTDAASAFFAIVLLWQQQLAWGVAVAIVPPVIATLLLVRFANLEPRKNSVLGRYIAQHMTANAQSIRLLGMVVMMLGAWYHVGIVIVLGFGMIAAMWALGALLPSNANTSADP